MAKPDNKPEGAKSADLVEAAESTAGLVKVKKHAETLHVHPDALAEHVRLGWNAAE